MVTIKGIKIDSLKNFFEKKEYIISAYLFGSMVGGSYGSKTEPDIDIAIFLSRNNPFKHSLDAKFKLEEEISKYLNEKEENIDILILNDAPSVISHEVFKTGCLIYEKDMEERIDFEMKKEFEYYDTKYLRNFFFEEIKKWVK